MELFRELRERWNYQATSSNNPPPVASIFLKAPNQVNESLYEVHKPKDRPAMQIYFFHGLQFGDPSKAHFGTTWQSEDMSCVWPETWLVEDFPNSQIFFVSYDSAVQKGSNSMDMYQITENLMHDILDQAGFGQESSCPIILVGHCFGGMVIKQLCLKMKYRWTLNISERETVKLQAFLDNIKGIFYYDTPHHGIRDLHKLTDVKDSPLLSYFESLSRDTERLNSDFHQLRRLYDEWRIQGLGASLPTKLSLSNDVMVVPESYGRDSEGDLFSVTDGVDHYTICKPRSKMTRSYYALKHLLNEIANDHEGLGHQWHGLPHYCPGLKERAHKVEEMCSSSMVVGIVGMGGIGKSTIAIQVFNNISREFEYTCFVDYVKGVPRHELGDWIREHFHRNGVLISGNGILWKGKKVLIVMDDVDSETQLNELRDLDDFGNDSCLIVTTRNRGVLRIYPEHAVYDVDLLTDGEAKRLFCQYAFGKEGLPNISPLSKNTHLEEGIVRVVEKCQGLPLTLELMGCYLRGHDSEAELWKEAIEKLGRAQAIDGDKEDRLFAALRVSVDALSEEERKMFIEAGTIFFKEPAERAFAAWSTAYESSMTAWENLLSRSLVKELEVQSWDGDKYKQIWVHEHLRDVAKKLEDFHMIYEVEGPLQKAVELLNANGMKIETRSLRLHNSDEESVAYIASRIKHSNFPWSVVSGKLLQLSSLERLENLKYLELLDVPHKGSGKNFPKKLSLLKWTTDTESSLKLPISLEGMNNLAVLELHNWKIAEEFSKELGSLVNLSILSLSSLDGLDRLPEDFGTLSCLKELELEDLSLSTLPRSFGNLSALRDLVIRSVGIVELPESFGTLSSLVLLCIRQCSQLASLPESFGNLSSLISLDIQNCEKLASLPESFGNLTSLTLLKIRDCESLASLPESFGNLSSLVTLEIDGCGRLASLSHSFGCLSSLKVLTVWGAMVKELGDSFGSLSTLCKLSLSSCEDLQGLSASFGDLCALEDLTLHNCTQLKTLPDSFGHLKALKSLSIANCSQVKRLPDNFGGLSALTYLALGCSNLESLPASFGLLSALEELKLGRERLQKLPDNFGLLKNLKNLTIEGAEHLEELPDSFGYLSALTSLRLVCPNLERLPESFGLLSCLEELDLEVGRNLRKLPQNFNQLKALTKLTVSFDHPELPDNFPLPTSLQNLVLRCDYVKQLPEVFGELESLQSLEIYCKDLVMLPNSIARLSSLKNLSLETQRLESLPESMGQLQSLKYLYIGAAQLESLPRSLGQLHSLSSLRIISQRVRKLPEELGNLTSLTTLKLKCWELETLPSGLGLINSLRELRLTNCNRLRTLPDSLRTPLLRQLVAPQRSKGAEQGQSSQTAATQEMTLAVVGCRRLPNSVLKKFGWEKPKIYWHPRKTSTREQGRDSFQWRWEIAIGRARAATQSLFQGRSFRSGGPSKQRHSRML